MCPPTKNSTNSRTIKPALKEPKTFVGLPFSSRSKRIFIKIMIKNFAELSTSEKEKFLPQIREIFFLSAAVKTFTDDTAKEKFFQRWCGNYLTFFPNLFFLSLSENASVAAYLCACFDTKNALSKLAIPGTELFIDLYKEFPIHFHINTHPNFRSQGIGGKLVSWLEKKGQEEKIPGLHIITTREQKNVNFYTRLGFSYQEERKKDENSKPLLFLGKSLL